MTSYPTIKRIVNDVSEGIIATVIIQGIGNEFKLVESISIEGDVVYFIRSFDADWSEPNDIINNYIEKVPGPMPTEEIALWLKRYFSHEDYQKISQKILFHK